MRLQHATAALAAASLMGFAAPAVAQDDGNHFSVTPYIWLPTVNADLSFEFPPDGPDLTPHVEVGPVDYLEDISGIFMMAGEARFDRFGAFTDIIYLDFSGEAASVATITGPGGNQFPIDVGSSGDMTAWMWTFAGEYQVINDEHFDVWTFAGVRYSSIDSNVNWSLQGPVGAFPQTGSLSREADNWDGVIGARGEGRAGNWIFPYYVDVGAGDSDLTWQASLGVGYRWGWGDLTLDYRYLEYEQGDDALIQDMTLGGPSLGATFRF